MKYFDRSFFRFLFGFLGIISLSILIMLAAATYASEEKSYDILPTHNN